MKDIIKYILVGIIILEFFVIISCFSNNKQLKQEVELIKQNNISLVNENNYLFSENERLTMINSEVWELFLAEHYIEKGEFYNE